MEKHDDGRHVPLSGNAAACYTVANERNGLLLGSSVHLASTSSARRKGLMGKSFLADGEGLWISPCEAIHTFGMRLSIDVVFIDRERRVRKLVPSLTPRRFAASLLSHSVLELAAGSIDRAGTRIGDYLRFSSTAEH